MNKDLIDALNTIKNNLGSLAIFKKELFKSELNKLLKDRFIGERHVIDIILNENIFLKLAEEKYIYDFAKKISSKYFIDITITKEIIESIFEIYLKKEKNREEDEKINVKILSIGGCGNNILAEILNKKLSKNNYIRTSFLAIDTDKIVLHKFPQQNRILLGEGRLKGRSCGANIDTGLEILNEEIETLLKILEKTNILILIAGISRGIGSAGAIYLPQLAKKLDIITISILAYPFKIEGYKRREIANHVILKAQKYSNCTFILKNDVLINTAHKKYSLYETFSLPSNKIFRLINKLTKNIHYLSKYRAFEKAGISQFFYGEGEDPKSAFINALKSNIFEGNILKAKKYIIYFVLPKEKLSKSLLMEINVYLRSFFPKYCEIKYERYLNKDINHFSIYIYALNCKDVEHFKFIKEINGTFFQRALKENSPKSRHISEKIENIMDKANKGIAEAQTLLGDFYLSGKLVEQSDTQAFTWYKKAALSGHSKGQLQLGKCYLDGIGTDKDPDKAIFWYKKAAENDSVEAIFQLANCYFYGKGVEKNIDLAVSLFLLAGKNGYTK